MKCNCQTERAKASVESIINWNCPKHGYVSEPNNFHAKRELNDASSWKRLYWATQPAIGALAEILTTVQFANGQKAKYTDALLRAKRANQKALELKNEK